MTSLRSGCVAVLIGLGVLAGPVLGTPRMSVEPRCVAGSETLVVTVRGVTASRGRIRVVATADISLVLHHATRSFRRRGPVSIRVGLRAGSLYDCTATHAAITVSARVIPGHGRVQLVRGRLAPPPLSGVVVVDPPAAERVPPVTVPADEASPSIPDASPLAPILVAPPLTTRLPGTTRTVMGLVGAPVIEASGLAMSRSQAGVFWTHNDSGDTARIFAIGRDGAIRATVPLAGIGAVDVEDIASGPGPLGTEFIYVADIGDNAAVRASVRVHRLVEPDLSGIAPGAVLAPVGVTSITLVYPDGPRDAEALVVDRTQGHLYIITKREARSRIYRLDAAQVLVGGGVLEFVGELAYGWVVGASACDDGRTVMVKTYGGLLVHESPFGLAAALLAPGVARPYLAEPQGEAVAVNAACTEYATLSEGHSQPLVVYGR
ncbi:MAG: hypothetical protein EXQ74_02045 [Thermoleophilia bacterium]|nr:hypothetical protein [Thermoleophilia bacterium]